MTAPSRPGVSSRGLDAAGVRHVEAAEAERLTGYAAPGLLLPYRNLDCKPMLTPDGRPFHRLRLDKPTGTAKYLSPKASGAQLYVPPGLRRLLPPGCDLYVIEGEFKALALVEAGFAAVGVGGISSACRRAENGGAELLPELAGLIAEARPARILFCGDSDTALIGDFSREAVKLAQAAGVPVALPRIPIDSPGKAPDDLRELLGDRFPERWREIIDVAETVTPATKPASLAVRLLRREEKALARLTGDALDKARERLVRLAVACDDDPLASAAVEEIAAASAGLSKTTLRAAAEKLGEQRKAPPAPEPNAESIIVLPSADLPFTEAAESIFGRIAPTLTLFHRGGTTVEIGTGAEGALRLEPIDAAQFRSRLETYGRLHVHRSMSDGKRVLKPTLCPEETAKALLVSLPARGLPAISRLAGCPILARDGDTKLALGPGWHPQCGGVFVTGGELPPRLPLPEAVALLEAVLADFDFTTEGDRCRALASFIAPALRFGGWLTGHLPIDLGEADASQSGKTYRQKLVAAVYRETCNCVVQKVGGVGGLDESIGQKLVDGRPFVLFDNLRGRFDSAYLEAVLTAPGAMPARIPHRGEVQVDASGFVFMLTSNGVETTRDLANRGSIIRIRKRPAGYRFARYPEGDVFAHIVANQTRFLGAVFAVVDHWIEQGRPRSDETRHDFREWAQTLDWIVRNVFNAAPLLDGHIEARERVGDPRRNWLRTLCISFRDTGRLGSEFHATQLAEIVIEAGLLPPNVKPDAAEQDVARTIGRVMASQFGEGGSVEVDGFTITRSRRYSQTAQKEIPAYSIALGRKDA